MIKNTRALSYVIMHLSGRNAADILSKEAIKLISKELGSRDIEAY